MQQPQIHLLLHTNPPREGEITKPELLHADHQSRQICTETRAIGTVTTYARTNKMTLRVILATLGPRSETRLVFKQVDGIIRAHMVLTSDSNPLHSSRGRGRRRLSVTISEMENTNSLSILV